MAVALTISPSVNADPGTESAAFLDIPVGARPAALGSAYTALADDAYAPVWNPAGLGLLTNTQLAAQHLSYLESIHYEFLSFVKPLRTANSCPSLKSCMNMALGGSVQYLGSGDITGLDRNGNPTGDFSSHYAAYSLAFGLGFNEKWSVGATGKVIDAELSDVGAQAFAADVGGLYRLRKDLTVAGSLTNLGTELKFLEESGPLPLAFRAGMAWQPTKRWQTTVEGVYRKNELGSAHVGVEWRPIELVALRSGYRTDNTKETGGINGLTAGLGLTFYGQEFSYAWVPYGDLGNTQYFSLVVNFGEAEKARRNLIHYQTLRQHRIVRARYPEKDDIEAQQLMQLLSGDESPATAQRAASVEGSAR